MLRLRALLVSALAFVTLLPAFAQTSRGSITGTVVDTQGSSIPNATVILTDLAQGTSVKITSNSSGSFSFPELAVGKYTLTVSFAGFQTRKIEDINVEVTKVVDEKVQLAVGSTETVIDVQANAVTTDTTSEALVAVIDSKAVAEMPMNGRNFTQMTHFAPGASALTNSVNGSLRPVSTSRWMVRTTSIHGWASSAPTRAASPRLRVACCRSKQSTSSPCSPVAKQTRGATPART